MGELGPYGLLVVAWSQARVTLEHALEGPEVSKPGIQADRGDRVVVSLHEANRMLDFGVRPPILEAHAHLLTKEGGEVTLAEVLSS